MSASIHVFYYTGPYTSTLLPGADALLTRISAARRQRFEQRIDGAQRALDLAALRLLELGMQHCGHANFKLADVDYPSAAGISAKPRWRGGAVDFSISHANGLAACAIGSGCLVGLDVEARRAIEPRIVRRVLAADACIADDLTADNALAKWTQIEAVLKAAGLGILHGRDIFWRSDAIVLQGQQWWLRKIDCGSDHVAHVALNCLQADLQVRAIDLA